MNLHEYQGKQLFAEYGLPVSKGYAVDTPEDAVKAAETIGGDMWVVKALTTHMSPPIVSAALTA
ncbi:MAG TPA: ATP-grasp domain-containing protein, partial [Kineobactrum sp.]